MTPKNSNNNNNENKTAKTTKEKSIMILSNVQVENKSHLPTRGGSISLNQNDFIRQCLLCNELSI